MSNDEDRALMIIVAAIVFTKPNYSVSDAMIVAKDIIHRVSMGK